MQQMVMSRPIRISGLIGLFFISFLFFLYFTFPYGVLKEALRSQIATATGIDVRMKSMGPKFPVGVTADEIEIRSPGSDVPLKFKQLKVSVGLLNLLIGRVGVGVGLVDASGGTLNAGVKMGILGLISGDMLPKSITLESERFPLDNIVKFALSAQANAPDANPMVAPLLKKIGMVGELNADVDFGLDSSDPSKSKGAASIKLNKAILKLNDPALSLPDQQFSKAQVLANLDNGVLAIDQSSGLTAQELELSIKGKVNVKANFMTSPMDLTIGIKLNKGLKDQFGFLVDAFTGSTSNGEVSLQLKGPLGAPSVTKF